VRNSAPAQLSDDVLVHGKLMSIHQPDNPFTNRPIDSLTGLYSGVCRSELWIVDEGTVTKYESDFEDFREELVREIQAEHEEDDKEKKYERPNGPNGP
jgi:hypothetical protein